MFLRIWALAIQADILPHDIHNNIYLFLSLFIGVIYFFNYYQYHQF